jgi:hypothetical protein
MKKILTLTCVISMLSIGAFAQVNILVKGGVQISTAHNWDPGPDLDVDMGYAAAVEVTYNEIPFVEVGGGIEYEFERALTDYQSSKFNFIPVYAVVRGVLDMPMFAPYAVGKIGYNLFLANSDYAGSGNDTTGGVYWSVGAGVIVVGLVVVEVAYTTNYGYLDFSGGIDITDSHFDISAGIKYSF